MFDLIMFSNAILVMLKDRWTRHPGLRWKRFRRFETVRRLVANCFAGFGGSGDR